MFLCVKIVCKIGKKLMNRHNFNFCLQKEIINQNNLIAPELDQLQLVLLKTITSWIFSIKIFFSWKYEITITFSQSTTSKVISQLNLFYLQAYQHTSKFRISEYTEHKHAACSQPASLGGREDKKRKFGDAIQIYDVIMIPQKCHLSNN